MTKTIKVLTEKKANIFAQGLSPEVVFDRKADAERTRQRALKAAEKAEQQGMLDKAERLRQEAGRLSEIIAATNVDPWETLDTDEDGMEDDAKQATHQEVEQSDENAEKAAKAPGSSDEVDLDSDDSESDDSKSQLDSESEADGEESDEESEKADKTDDSQEKSDGEGNKKNADDIDNLEDGNGGQSHGSSQSGQSEDNHGSSQGSNTGGGKQGKSGQSSSKGNSKEFDPFGRMQLSNGQGEQITPEQELEAIIKRLSELQGNAKAGADRALRDYFDQIGGSGLDD